MSRSSLPQTLEEEDASVTTMIKQSETRPISQEQLVAEVKGIYAGLVMVESKCIEVDSAQSAQTGTDAAKLSNDQWQALIALHRTLLHEHHDFFLASQYPLASTVLRRLALKYAMPARLWRHGIHSFLELLRHRLPALLEHMLAFIYLAYAMMALLFETVSVSKDTWIECLGDLGRYRTVIQNKDEGIRQRDKWKGSPQHRYSKVSDEAPTVTSTHQHDCPKGRRDFDYASIKAQGTYFARSDNIGKPSSEPFYHLMVAHNEANNYFTRLENHSTRLNRERFHLCNCSAMADESFSREDGEPDPCMVNHTIAAVDTMYWRYLNSLFLSYVAC